MRDLRKGADVQQCTRVRRLACSARRDARRASNFPCSACRKQPGWCLRTASTSASISTRWLPRWSRRDGDESCSQRPPIGCGGRQRRLRPRQRGAQSFDSDLDVVGNEFDVERRGQDRIPRRLRPGGRCWSPASPLQLRRGCRRQWPSGHRCAARPSRLRRGSPRGPACTNPAPAPLRRTSARR